MNKPGRRARATVIRDRSMTVLLALFVILSMVLSGLVWTGTPVQVNVERTGFFSGPPPSLGRAVTSLLIPDAIWLWTSSNELYRMSGNSPEAARILADLQKASVRSVHVVRPARTSLTLPPPGASLRIDFAMNEIDASLLSGLMPNLRTSFAAAVENPVYIVPAAGGRYRIVFALADKRLAVATLGHLPASFAGFFRPTDSAIPYVQIPVGRRVFDLPYDALGMTVQVWSLTTRNATEMIDSFYTDPSLVQTFSLKKQGTLYTDGTLGVQVQNGPFGTVLAYRDPSVAVKGTAISALQDLEAAISFVNDHGGFIGEQMALTDGRAGLLSGHFIAFRGVIGGWPLFGTLDRIETGLENGTVVSMRRATVYLGQRLDVQLVTILSGPQLVSVLGERYLSRIAEIRLGYGSAVIGGGMVRLSPVYQLTGEDGRVRYLDAVTGYSFHGSGMTSWTSGA